MKTILITGAAGFLGNHFITQMLNTESVFIIYLGRTKININNDHLYFIHADLSKKIPIRKLPSKIDAVFHFAQSYNYKNFPAKAHDIFSINTCSTQNLLDIAVKTKVENFIYSSTGSVYEPENTGEENNFVSPRSFYGASKLCSENIIYTYGNYFNTCILRLFNLFGPNQQSDRLIPSIIKKIDLNERIQLRGGPNGPTIFPTFIDDAVNFFIKAYEQSWSGTYNAAGINSYSLREVAHKIGRILNKDPIFEEFISPHIQANISFDKLKQVYDTTTLCDFNKSLEKTVRFYCDH